MLVHVQDFPTFIQQIKAISAAELSDTAGVKITLGHWQLRNRVAFTGY